MWIYSAVIVGLTVMCVGPAQAQDLASAASGLTAEAQERPEVPKGQAMTGTNRLADVEDVSELSLDDLLNAEVSVASTTKRSIRRSSAIVTLVSREQILNSGARDLVDVLRMVPGFDFHLDVQGSIGMSVRGNWAQEGKVLVLLDGIALSDLQYSTVQYAFRVPVEQIERIEIIRGPGSGIGRAHV